LSPRQPEDIPDGFVAVARIVGAWGIRGDLKIGPLAPPAVLAKGRSVLLDGEQHAIESSSAVSLKLSGIDDRDAAISRRGRHLLVCEDDLEPLPEGEYYRFQLIGLRAVTTAGEDLGEVTEVFSTGANDVLVIRGSRGEVLVPAVEDVLVRVDLAGGAITVEPVPGLLPDSTVRLEDDE
jgi:16S rRNA processing protein RimM